MEWINLRKGERYILEPRGMKSKELLKALTEAEVVLIQEPSIPPDPGDFAYKIQEVGNKTNRLHLSTVSNVESWMPMWSEKTI